MVKFLNKNIFFSHFGTPRVLIIDGGSHLCNIQLAMTIKHYGIRHKFASPYHPKTNDQAKVSKREIKSILEKTISSSKRD